MIDREALKQLAATWINRGATVLPLRGDKKDPVAHLVPRGFIDASNDPDDLWWFEHEDTELVGIVPGSIGALVLDVDVKNDANGNVNLEQLEREFGTLPEGSTITTRSGGWHIYLEKPDPNERIGNKDLCPGVNVRCDNGYVVAPGNPAYGSLNTNWRRPAPDWVMERLRAPAADAADYEAADEHRESEWHPTVLHRFEQYDGTGDRHTKMVGVVNALASYELLGYAGSTSALDELEDLFVESVRDRSSEAEAHREYRRALRGARERVRSHESSVIRERELDTEFIEQIVRENGGTDEDVAKVQEIAKAQALQPDNIMKVWPIGELMKADLNLSWMIRNVLIAPTYGQIAGPSKSLKTFLSQYLAVAVASKEPFLGQFPVERQGPVVVFVGEGGRVPWTRRLPRIAKSVGVEHVEDLPIYATFETAPILSPKFKDTVAYVLDKIDPVLAILDPLYSFHGGTTNSANLHEEGALLTAMADPFVEHESNLMIVNHYNRSTGRRSLDRITMAGSGEWSDSWWLSDEREPPMLDTGDFHITVEFGSRQWGGIKRDIDLNTGAPADEGFGEGEQPIQLSVRANYE